MLPSIGFVIAINAYYADLSPSLMWIKELDDADKAILAELLRETIERNGFPLSPSGNAH